MRIRTGHRPQDWQDIGEGYAGSIPLRGSLVVGGPAVSDEVTRANRSAAQKTYRAKIRDQFNAKQRERRQRKAA